MSEDFINKRQIKPGDIYGSSTYGYCLVLACDEIQVFFFRFYWPTNTAIIPETVHFKMEYSSYSFERMQTDFFLKTCLYLTSKEFTKEEHKLLRPDLPLMIGRSKLLSWKSISQMSSPKDLYPYGKDFRTKLTVDAIYVRPHGTRGGFKSSKRIEASNGETMVVADIMWQAAKYQAKVFADDRFGVGIFRTAIKNRKPEYYLWGFHTKSRSTLFYDLGTQDACLATFGIPIEKVRTDLLLVNKKNKIFYEVKIANDDVPIQGTILQLFLKWDPEPLMRFQIPSYEFVLDLSEYPPGIYYMLLSNAKENIYAYESDYHLIRDDHDLWIYVHPDLKNITNYSKKTKEPKKVDIPEIPSNANMKKYEKKIKELLADEKIKGRGDIMDMEEHGFQLHYFDLNEADSHFDALSEQGFQGGGPTWYGIISGAIQLADPTLNDEIYIDDDSEGIIISSKSKAVLEKMSHLIGILKSEPELLAASIHIAEKNEMID
ncbi:MAG: hypothetical protein EA362_01095 [Saprospirales bacterium]|nr:MAG: hypothetical protein EA362_01095 [Saprospirales bacterium]